MQGVVYSTYLEPELSDLTFNLVWHMRQPEHQSQQQHSLCHFQVRSRGRWPSPGCFRLARGCLADPLIVEAVHWIELSHSGVLCQRCESKDTNLVFQSLSAKISSYTKHFISQPLQVNTTHQTSLFNRKFSTLMCEIKGRMTGKVDAGKQWVLFV